MSGLSWYEVAALLSTVATIILAFLTYRYVSLTQKLLNSQTEPCVIVSVVHDIDRPTILQLVVKNIGHGVAYGIKFEFSTQLPTKAFGIDINTARDAAYMTSGPLIDGIPALSPSETRVIDWGQYGGLKKAIGNNDIEVRCCFKNDMGQARKTVSHLDVESFATTVAYETNLTKIAKSLESIAKSVQHLTSGFYALHVRVLPHETTDDFPEQADDGPNPHV